MNNKIFIGTRRGLIIIKPNCYFHLKLKYSMAEKQPKKKGKKRSLKRIIWIAWNYELKERFILYCNIKKRGCEGGGEEKRRQVN